MGDIALPNIDYDRELAYEQPKQEEVEKYKQEVLEGLQIEEEGLTAFIRKKTKQPSTLFTISNDPIDNDATISEDAMETPKSNIKANVLRKNKGSGDSQVKKKEDQERLFKTQSNSREIFEGIGINEEIGLMAETTTQNIKVRHNRKIDNENKKGHKNRRGRKRHRRKNNKRKEKHR